MLTHRNLVANVAQIRPLHGMVADDVVLAVLPFFHIYGMTVLLNAALHARARLVVMPSFDLGDFLGNIQNHKCTIAFIAPPVAVALAKHPLIDDYDLSSLNTVMSGAAPLDADLGRAVAERLGCRVVQGYGMSELSPVSHITPFDGGEHEMKIDRAAELGRMDGVQRRIEDRRPRDRRRNRCSRRGSQRDRGAVVQGPQRDGGLSGQREGHQGDHRRRRLAAHRRPRAGRRATAACTSSTGSRS